MFEITGINRVNPAKNHGMNFLKAGERVTRGMPLVGNRVADLDIRS